MATILYQRLNKWREKRVYAPIELDYSGLHYSIRCQDVIGWESLMHGCIIKNWAMVQHH